MRSTLPGCSSNCLSLVRRTWRFWIVAIALAVPTEGMAQSSAKKAKPASKPAPRISLGVPVQGEYTGTLRTDDGSIRNYGFQIVALGDGKYAGVEFRGGLPGNYADREYRVSSLGEVQRNGTVKLTSSPPPALPVDLPSPAPSLPVDHLKGDTHHYLTNGRIVEVRNSRDEVIGVLEKTIRRSRFLGARAPKGAIVLFGGRNTSELVNAKVNSHGNLQVGCETARSFQDFELHLEFRTPSMETARGQARGNSGVYIQGRYEVQILDSFGLEPQNNDCGSLYKQRAPKLNMCFPAESWQTYDIRFQAARFDEQGNKTQQAKITVWHNGIKIHNQVSITAKTGAGAPEGPEPRPIKFQDHGDNVEYRNIWIIEHNQETKQ